MNFLKSKNKIKYIIICIILIILMNVILPKPIYAGLITDTIADIGGSLMEVIFRFVAGIFDLIMKILQGFFLEDGDINDAGLFEDPDFKIGYSPAAIFLGYVPALDANFINPSNEWVGEGNVAGDPADAGINPDDCYLDIEDKFDSFTHKGSTHFLITGLEDSIENMGITLDKNERIKDGNIKNTDKIKDYTVEDIESFEKAWLSNGKVYVATLKPEGFLRIKCNNN